MIMASKRDSSMREILVVDDPDTIKILMGGKSGDILDLIDSREMSVSEIARAMKINPGSAHYHLKELEKRGLVDMVREETKGNVVKKYYRAAARRIFLDSSRFKTLGSGEINPMDNFFDRLLPMMSYFGYGFPPEKAEQIKDLIRRYTKRRNELLRQIQDIGIEDIESDRMVVSDAYSIALLLREVEDDELQGIANEIRALALASRSRP